MAGTVDVISSGSTPTITIDGNSASISVGGNGMDGELVIRDAAGNAILLLKAIAGQVSIQRPSGQSVVEIGEDITVYDTSLHPIAGVINESTALYVGGELLFIDPSNGSEYIRIGLPDKTIEIRNPQDEPVLIITTGGQIVAGGNGADGTLILLDKTGHARITVGGKDTAIGLLGETGHIQVEIANAISVFNQTGGKTTVIEGGHLYLGGGGVDGTLSIIDETGEVRVRIGGAGQEISVVSPGDGASVEIQGGRILLANHQGQVVDLNKSGDMILGGGGEDGSLALRDKNGTARVSLSAEPNVALRNSAGAKLIELRNNGDIRAGGGGQTGGLVLADNDGAERVSLSAEPNIALKNSAGAKLIELQSNGDIRAGGGGQAGDLVLADKDGTETIRAGGGSHNIVLKKDDGTPAVELGRKGLIVHDSGYIRMRDNDGNERIHVSGETVSIRMRDEDGNERIQVSGETASIRLGGNGTDGRLALFSAAAKLSGELGDDLPKSCIWLDGNTGDIRLSAADCAEDFSIEQGEEPGPGTVLVAAADNLLQPCSQPYDRRVAGVVSGAGAYRAGIVLDKQPDAKGRVPVALAGKVHCKVDTTYGPIEPGDLLTTSHTPGHAMAVRDYTKAFGAVLGKALCGLREGRASIPILVALE